MARYGRRQLHQLYYHLKLTRRLEEELARLHREGRIPGALHLDIGGEAVSVGAAYPLKPGDWLSSSLPSIGSLLVRGISPALIAAHLMGKSGGPMQGRDGSIHLGDRSRGLVPSGGHLAMHLGVMAGVALAATYLQESSVALALVGERAVATGDFHEGLNFAAVHRLPLVVFVESGPLGPIGKPPRGPYLYERMRGYGVPSLPVDGIDILQVLQVAETALERARTGKGPTFIEATTFRRLPHPTHPDASPVPFRAGLSGWNEEEAGEKPQGEELAPRSREERSGDPVEHFETFLVEHGLLQPVERGLIVERIERLVEDAVRSADEDVFPDVSGLSDGVLGLGPGEEADLI